MDNFVGEIFKSIINLENLPIDVPGALTRYIINLITNGFVLLFAAVIIIAIFYAVLAGFKYIRSQGDSEKVEEAQNALKSVFIGIVTVFLGVIVVILISGIFSNQGAEEVRRALCVFVEPYSNIESCVRGSSI